MLGLRFSKERTKKLATGNNFIMWNLVIVNPAYRGLDDQLKDNEMEGAMARMGEFHTEFWWKNMKEGLKDLGALRRIILKYIF
jgi:hypothetical protein